MVIVLISYISSNDLRFPDFGKLKKFYQKRSRSQEDWEDSDVLDPKKSQKLVKNLVSFETCYYFLLTIMSALGSVYYGYFFSIHLLHVVTFSEMLKGIITAVTQNGRSLIGVALLASIFLYIYALIGFAFFRSSFNPDDELYCRTLYECTVTLIRYGVIGDINEKLTRHRLENNFLNFTYLTIYHVIFFIVFTTIGLNIAFGIIVDTFSELRDLKWRAEKDMHEVCFICNRNSYEFEHHGKGFNHHVKNEHNLWTYIHYFIHLKETKMNEYTALDLYVFKMLQKKNFDFFPMNKALALVGSDNSSDNHTELLREDLSFLVQNTRENIMTHKLEKEAKRQMELKEEFEEAVASGDPPNE